MTKYRNKLEVEAFQWVGKAPSKTDPPWIREAYEVALLHYERGCPGCGRHPHLVLECDESQGGDVDVLVGDWLVHPGEEVDGEIRSCKDDIFRETYEPVEGGAPIQEPPLGCAPRWLRDEQRLEELCRAVANYREAGQQIPLEWLSELGVLAVRVRERGRAMPDIEIKPGVELDQAVAEAIGLETGVLHSADASVFPNQFLITPREWDDLRGVDHFTCEGNVACLPFSPSTDKNAAFAAAEKVRLFDHGKHHATLGKESNGRIWEILLWGTDDDDSIIAPTPALAICAAILKLAGDATAPAFWQVLDLEVEE